jgi:hypothetical protein
VNEFLRLSGHRAQGLSPNNSMILFHVRSHGRDTLRQPDYQALYVGRSDCHWRAESGGRPDHLSAGTRACRKRREAPACMRCRGLTGCRQAADLPIPQRARTLPDHHLIDSPYAIPGPPASRKLSGLPPRGPAVQVMNEFLLRTPTGTQVLSVNLFKILFSSTARRLLSPAIAAYPPDTHSFLHSRRSRGRDHRPAEAGGRPSSERQTAFCARSGSAGSGGSAPPRSARPSVPAERQPSGN